MTVKLKRLVVSAPGRVCLFGEHQDYLLLPVIPAAISLRISIDGERRPDPLIRIELPDVNSHVEFSLSEPVRYTTERDYFRSTVNVMREAGFTFSGGFDCTVRGNIPINAGTSSSSALVVAWTNFLARMSDQKKQLPPLECAGLSYAAEVLEFKEPGGMMDQYSSSFGGVLYLEFHPSVRFKRINAPLESFVLGNSGEPKKTKYILSNVKQRVHEIVRIAVRKDTRFSLHTVSFGELDRYRRDLTSEQMALLRGTIRNRDITSEALGLFRKRKIDKRAFGSLLNEHQSILRDILQVSTKKIDLMLEAALAAGAYGGKINGSGGGGCMFVYAPENPEIVASAIDKAGGKSYIVRIDGGVRDEKRTDNL